MMLPALTAWPPKSFTPRRLPALSRPLRDEPPAFLCAIVLSPSGRRDLGDAHDGQVLAVAALAPIVLAALLLEDDDLRAAGLLDHGRRHGRARDGGGAEGEAAFVAQR